MASALQVGSFKSLQVGSFTSPQVGYFKSLQVGSFKSPQVGSFKPPQVGSFKPLQRAAGEGPRSACSLVPQSPPTAPALSLAAPESLESSPRGASIVLDFDSANEFVLSAFENWRKQMNLEQFDLCAHSMGAIFASSYAIEHPDAVKHLVLVSPAGVPHPPPPPKPDSEEARARNRSWLRRFAFSMWENGVTPMSITRFVGPYGPQLVSNILHKRISFMPANSAMRDGSLDLNDLSEYLYHNWALKPSGERTMTTHLAPGAHAVRPLVDTLSPEAIKMPLTFIYGGGSDWMDYRHGLKVVERFERKGKSAELFLVPDAGHQVFLDNPNGFNRVLVDCLSSKPDAVDTTATL